MVRPFEEIWAEAEGIWGLVLEPEVQLLYDAAVAAREANFLEVGSLCGLSAAVLGMVAMDRGGTLTCVDDYSFVHAIGSNCVNRIMNNLRRRKVRFTMMMMTSEEATPQVPGPFDLIHIDSNHRYEPVKTDCCLWLPKLTSGGFAAFHDYNRLPGRPAHPGVKQAVDECIEGLHYSHWRAAGRMEILQKGAAADAYSDF